MLTSGRIGYARLRAGSLMWRSAIAIVFLAAVVPAEAGDGNWSGFYAGLNAGGAWGSPDANIGCVDGGLVIGQCAVNSGFGLLPSSATMDTDGFIGGGQAGYNFQSGKMVFGIEADIAWSSIDGDATLSAAITAPAVASTTQNLSQGLDWLGTVRGRLGYAAHNNLLIYATGGLAYGHVDYQYSITWGGVAAGDFARASESKTKAGWTVGGGGEYSFGHWSLKGEYLYYDLGDEEIRAQAFDGGFGFVDLFHTPDFETKGHIIRAGVNFKFGQRSREPVPLK